MLTENRLRESLTKFSKEMTNEMIEFRNVTKKFGDFTAVEDISFKVEPSSIYGLIGYNGAGKTTLLKTAAGIYKADGGQVLIDGEDTYDNDNNRRNMFYIPDDLYFPMNANVYAMAKFYADYHPTFSFKTFEKLLDVYGLDGKKKIRGFSKGMQRQVEIILALASRPKYLLLDETFDGLDPQKKRLQRSFLWNIWQKQRLLLLFHHIICQSFLTFVTMLVLLTVKSLQWTAQFMTFQRITVNSDLFLTVRLLKMTLGTFSTNHLKLTAE